jgi:membrane associated rhomboid family serine protease
MRSYYNNDDEPRDDGFRVSFSFGWTTTVKVLIAANVAAFVATLIALRAAPQFDLFGWFGMCGARFLKGAYWQPITYMFIHNGPMHLVGNMLGLYFFAGPVERSLGRVSFLAMYFLCGVAGAMLSLLQPGAVVIGASGGVLGVVAAFAMLFPEVRIFVMLMFPVRARTVALIYAFVTVASLLWPGQDDVSHWAHLGGLAVGFLYVMTIPWAGRLLGLWRAKRARWEANRSDAENSELDRILEKVHHEGITALSNQERDFLNLMSRRKR